MSAPCKVFPSIAFLVSLLAALPSAADQARSTSASRQFLVYGAEIRLRGEMCNLAERTKSDLLRLLGLRDTWKTPLIIKLDHRRANLPDAPLVQLDVSQLGYGLKLQLNLLVTGDMMGRALERELLRAILVEMMYRDRPEIAAGRPYVTPPDWLLEGMLALQPGRDSNKPAELLRTIVASKKICPLEDVVRQRRTQLDEPWRQLHEAYSRALVQFLLGVPGGQSKVVQFITDLPDAPNDVVADLRAHFSATLGRAPRKWWALSVAQFSARDRSEILSAAETVARLDRILRFSIPAPDGPPRNYSLGEYKTFSKLPASRAVLRQVGEQLLLLGARAHPSYRSIVQEDYELAEMLARGKTRRVPERLDRVENYRAVVERQDRAIDDYLNWYEATQSKTKSGAFSQIFATTEASGEALPRRRDPISVYLDSLEMEVN